MKRALTILLFLSLGALYGEESPIHISIQPGEHYTHRHWFGIFPARLTPQIAVWAEDGEGRFLKTLYLTERSARNSWRGTDGGRPEALPLYDHARNRSENTDGVSGASVSSGPLERQTAGDFSGGTVLIRAEVNSSFDYNSRYGKENSGVNGQPSLLYEALWNSKEDRVSLEPAGKGDLRGESGIAEYNLNGLTTALGIIESITLSR
jgi:hypothetical protein